MSSQSCCTTVRRANPRPPLRQRHRRAGDQGRAKTTSKTMYLGKMILALLTFGSVCRAGAEVCISVMYIAFSVICSTHVYTYLVP